MGDDEDFWDEEARSEAAMEAAGEACAEAQALKYIEDNQPELAEQFYEQNREQAIEDFRVERLQQFYSENPNVAEKALNCLNYATALLPTFPRASLVFSASSTEITMKYVLLRPILAGFIHDEDLAAIIVKETTDLRKGSEITNFLARILEQYGHFSLKKFKRHAMQQTYWEEIIDLAKLRNRVVHLGEDVTAADAKLASEVAQYALHTVMPLVVSQFGFHLHAPATICIKTDCGFSPAARPNAP